MFPHPQTTRPEKGLDAAGRVFTTHGITRVPVVDTNQRLVGILSEHDIVSALLAPPQPTAGEHVAALRMGLHPAAGEPLTAASLADRGVTVLPANASMDDMTQAIFGAQEPLALVIDEAGRLIGRVDEHALLAHALPEAPAGMRAALGRFFSRSSGSLTQALAGAGGPKGRAPHAADLAQPVPISVASDTPAADVLARMIVPPGYDYAVIVLTDRKPDGVVWRQTALRVLIGG
jgi:CBS domain-containing protein